MKNVCVFFADGCEEIEGLTVVDLLRRAGIAVTMVSINKKKKITGSHNIIFKADVLFKDMDFSDVDMLVLPGGMPGTTSLGAYAPLLKLIKKFDKKEKYLAAICAAPSVFSDLGLLKEKKATSYPSFQKKLECQSYSKEKTIVDGHIITSRGVGTAIDFAAHLAAILTDQKTADALLQEIVY